MNSMTKGFNTDEFRKKREAERMGERQTRKEAFIAKRRNVDGSFGTGDAQSEESELPSRQLFKQAATGISAACKKLASTNPQSVLYAVRQIRTIVSSGK